MVKVKKRNGRYEEFIESKIVTAVQKAGASAEEAKHVANEVYKKVATKAEVTANDLSNMVIASLSKVNIAAAGNFAKFRDLKLLLALWNQPLKDVHWPPEIYYEKHS